MTTLPEKRKSFEPTNMQEAIEFSKILARSTMVPKQYQQKHEDVLVAIQWGYELGLAPLQALQNIAVINGKPSVYGDAAMGLVWASGLCELFNEYIEGEGDNRRAVCITKRKGQPNERKQTFSVADAKKANLWRKQGPWTQYEERMLQMRARGFLLRDVYADVLKGLITAEEAEDYPTETKDVTPRHPLPEAENPKAVEAGPAPVDARQAMKKEEPKPDHEPPAPVTVEGEVVERPPSYGIGKEKAEEVKKALVGMRRHGWSVKLIEELYRGPIEELPLQAMKDLGNALRSCKSKDAVSEWVLAKDKELHPEGPEPEKKADPKKYTGEFAKDALIHEIEMMAREIKERGVDPSEAGMPVEWDNMKTKLSVSILTDLKDSIREWMEMGEGAGRD